MKKDHLEIVAVMEARKERRRLMYVKMDETQEFEWATLRVMELIDDGKGLLVVVGGGEEDTDIVYWNGV